MSNNLWSIENFGVQNSREACHKRPQEFQVSIGDFRVEPVKGRREIENRDDKLAKKKWHAIFFFICPSKKLLHFIVTAEKWNNLLKIVNPMIVVFPLFFTFFLQCLLDVEMSQIHVYFLQIGFVTPAKKRSPWSEKIIYCISTSTIAVSYFFRYRGNYLS